MGFIATHHAGNHIAMPAQKLGGAVQYITCTQRSRLLQHGGGEGGIHQHRHLAGSGNHRLDIDQIQGGIGGGFDNHQHGVGAAFGGDVVGGHKFGLQPAHAASQ